MKQVIEQIRENMVPVLPGAIVLQDKRIKRSWKVEVKPFLIARYPVTCEQYGIVTNNKRIEDADKKKPVVNVSWQEAISYCNALSRAASFQSCYTISANGEDVTVNLNANGYRLPTEAEWEYACRAGNDRLRYGELDAIAWFRGNAEKTTHEVGQKAPNAWNLHDMIGNVWEWCWDVYDKDVYGSYRVFRGGGWCDEHWGCTASGRRRSHPTFQIDDLGFRLAQTLLLNS